MNRGKDRQICAALFAAATAPLLRTFAALPFRLTLLACAVTAPILWSVFTLARRRPMPLLSGTRRFGRTTALLCCGFFLLAAAGAAARSASAFPETGGVLWAGLPVLALAALTAGRGTAVVLRCGSILALVFAPLWALVLIFSAPAVELRWLAPAGRLADCLRAAPVLLLPAAGLFFIDRSPGPRAVGGLQLALPLTAAAVSVVAGGCLSPRIAAAPDSVHLLAQSVSVLGVVRRFEALTSAADLAGCWLLCALLLRAAGTAAEICLPRLPSRQRGVALTALAAALLFPAARLPQPVSAALTGIFCGLLPLLLLGVGDRKIFCKIQKKS